MQHLHHVEQQRHAGHHQHEDDEDGLLCGPGDKALHMLPAGVPRITGYLQGQDEAIEVVLANDEAHLKQDLEEDVSHVANEQRPPDVHLAILVCVLGRLQLSVGTSVLLEFPSELLLLVDDVQNVTQVHEGGDGDEDDLEDPESHMGDGEGLVVAGVPATRRQVVAVHAGLLICPHLHREKIHYVSTCKRANTLPFFPFSKSLVHVM